MYTVVVPQFCNVWSKLTHDQSYTYMVSLLNSIWGSIGLNKIIS